MWPPAAGQPFSSQAFSEQKATVLSWEQREMLRPSHSANFYKAGGSTEVKQKGHMPYVYVLLLSDFSETMPDQNSHPTAISLFLFFFHFFFCLLINFKESIIVDSIDSGP